ncbi:glycoside hydrolase family 3 protein [Carboxylicivirga caseinilyticus]|uniref:glycoside hydrolase family 3 protein n=1 Tax=Carboxylicivirga caseinilyticus TaxID=3417572 RepID=UPI003D347C83|nr:glycoside hydrolase family 3 protein [Marinilabiliaceae bacterium A049]
MKNLLLSIIILSGLFFASCQPSTKKELPKQTDSLSVNKEWQKLSVREKVGQLVCYQFNKNEMLQLGGGSYEQFFQKYPIGSIFLANWNIAGAVSADSVKNEYIKIVNQCKTASKNPLLFTEDFETGLGFVIDGYTQLVTEMGLGAIGSEELAEQYGAIIASEARSIGINWLLHPVADLNINPYSYITNVRSIGKDPDLAIKLLPAQIKGMQTKGVAATAKHFPGDGTDFINQHFSTSQNKLSVEEWNSTYGMIFQTFINDGVKVIMPGHISFPAYQKEKLNDEFLPATLSSELIQGLLKDKMGFNGVVVSDALNMAGIAQYYSSQIETEVECFKAGTDILLWPSLAVIDTIEARINRGEITMSRLDDAVERIWNLKAQLGLFEDDYQTIIPLSDSLLEKHHQTAFEISKKALTLISKKETDSPFLSPTDQKILLVEVMQDYKEGVFDVLVNELKQRGMEVTVRRNLSYFESGSELTNLALEYDKIIFTYYSLPGVPWGDLSLSGREALTMWASNMLPKDKVISLGFGDPYKNIIYLPRIETRINCYNIDSYSQRALAGALLGDFELTGKSPVSYPEL